MCSGVAKGYRVEDQALEMDRKVGDSFWSAREGGEKQTNKNIFCFNAENSVTNKIKIAIKSKICFAQPPTTFQSVGDKCPTTALVSMQCI